jgi:hypothetical protein
MPYVRSCGISQSVDVKVEKNSKEIETEIAEKLPVYYIASCPLISRQLPPRGGRTTSRRRAKCCQCVPGLDRGGRHPTPVRNEGEASHNYPSPWDVCAPMAAGNLLAYCDSGPLPHSSVVNADWLADETLVRSLSSRMVCTKCGMVGADVLALATAGWWGRGMGGKAWRNEARRQWTRIQRHGAMG